MKTVLVAALALLLATPALASQPVIVVQKGRMFHPDNITIRAGQTVYFENKDEFLHQIYVYKGNIDYDSREQPPGETLHITFPRRGTYEIRCHIHPTMRLTIHVR
jgi:plastocyanin